MCGPGALKVQQQDAAVLDSLQARFEFLSKTPNTPARFVEGSLTPEGDTKRLMLDRANYYATTGGHGACRGCGEVTAIRLVTSTNHAIQTKRHKEHARELEAVIENLDAKLMILNGDGARRERIAKAREILEKRLYLLESGPTGNGPASAVIANATGCSSVYASTFPFNPYNDPWVNSLFQDAPAVAKGLFEGLAAAATDDIKALRIARLELDDAYDPAMHDKYLKTFAWADFTPEEMALLPTVISMGGDGATYDIGFGALSRLLATQTPDQGRGAQHRRLFQHRRTGLHGEPYRSGLRPGAVRFRPSRQAGGPQGTRPDRGLPPQRVRGPGLDRSAGALPEERHGLPEPYLVAGGARHLHALPGRARHRRRGGKPALPPRRRVPHEPGVRAQSARQHHAPRPVQP